MTSEKNTPKQTWSRIQRGLALGLAFPSLLVFSVATQAQTSKFSTSRKSMLGATKVMSPSKSTSRRSISKPSKGKQSSVSSKPSILGSRISRSSSIGISNPVRTGKESNPSSNYRVGISNSRFVWPGNNRGAGQSRNQGSSNRAAPEKPDTSTPLKPPYRGGFRAPLPELSHGIPIPPRSDGNGGNGGGGITIPGLGNGIPIPPRSDGNGGNGRGGITIPGVQGPWPDFPIRIPHPIISLPDDTNLGGGRIPTPDLGRFRPERTPGPSNVVKPDPSPSITESNERFDTILGGIITEEPNPINFKDFVKELPNKLKPELNPERQEMVLGARKTMGLRFGIGAGCHWWVDLLCGWHWHRHGCYWTDLCVVPGYWSCWRPCHYRVVWCPTIHGHVRSAWYFGVESFLIPDMHALGVHEVSPYSPAAMAGLQPGDMILSVNGFAFDNESVLPEMIQTSGGLLNLEVYREGLEAPMVVQVRLRRLRITSH